MTDLEPLEEYLRIWSFGKIYTVNRTNPEHAHWKTLYTWNVTNRTQVTTVAMAMWTRLSPRRRLQIATKYDNLNAVKNGKMLNPFS